LERTAFLPLSYVTFPSFPLGPSERSTMYLQKAVALPWPMFHFLTQVSAQRNAGPAYALSTFPPRPRTDDGRRVGRLGSLRPHRPRGRRRPARGRRRGRERELPRRARAQAQGRRRADKVAPPPAAHVPVLGRVALPCASPRAQSPIAADGAHQARSTRAGSISTRNTSAVRAPFRALALRAATDTVSYAAVVWTRPKMERLIDSLMHNFYIPPIIFGPQPLPIHRVARSRVPPQL
jgi:hypothetical protein